jgi:hypothetical protein
MNLTELKKILENKSQQELTQEILTLYKKIPTVKEYYQVQYGDTPYCHVGYIMLLMLTQYPSLQY